MANPTFQQDSTPQDVDSTVNASTTATYYKRGVNPQTNANFTGKVADVGVGTHAAGGAVGTTDTVVLAGVKNSSGNAAPLLTDANGAVQVGPTKAAGTDRSGSLTTGGTAQNAAASNANRTYFLIQNIDAGEEMWLSVTGTAAASTAGSFYIPARGGMVWEGDFCPTGAVSVVAATAGHKWSALEM